MKTPIKSLAVSVLAIAGPSLTTPAADNVTVLRICEDQHVLRTSDGAEAGHLEYIVVEPGQQRIVSTVITGGIVGTRHISVPFTEFQLSGEREVVLHGITREQMVSAPVIEVERFRTNSVVESTVFEKSTAYFHRDAAPGQERTRTSVEIRDGQNSAPGGPERSPGTAEQPGRDPRNMPPGSARDARPGSPAGVEREIPNGRVSTEKQSTVPAPSSNEKNAARTAQDEKATETTHEPGNARTKGSISGAKATDARSVKPESKAEGETAASEKSTNISGKNGKGSAVKNADSEEKGKASAQKEKSPLNSATAKHGEKEEFVKEEKSTDHPGVEKSEKEKATPKSATAKHGKKEESAKEEKSSDHPASEKSERKEPKPEENR